MLSHVQSRLARSQKIVGFLVSVAILGCAPACIKTQARRSSATSGAKNCSSTVRFCWYGQRVCEVDAAQCKVCTCVTNSVNAARTGDTSGPVQSPFSVHPKQPK